MVKCLLDPRLRHRTPYGLNTFGFAAILNIFLFKMSQLSGYNHPLVVKVFSFNEANETYTQKSPTLCQKLREAVLPEREGASKTQPDIIFICTQESNIGRIFNQSSLFHENIACDNCLGREYYALASNEVRANGFFAGLYKPKNVKTTVFVRRSMFFSPEAQEKASCSINVSEHKIKGPVLFPLFSRDAKGYIQYPPQFLPEVQRDPRFNMLANKVYGDMKVDMDILRFEGRAKSYKSAVGTTLEFGRYKLIVINCHFFFSNNDKDQGYKERVDDLVKTVQHFKLEEKHRQGWNIILCGDLNFRNNPTRAIRMGPIRTQRPSNITKDCYAASGDVRKLENKEKVDKCARDVYNLYHNDPNALEYINELSLLKHENPPDSFIERLLRTNNMSNITCAYKTGKEIADHRPAYSNLAVMKHDKPNAPRIPSTCDQILYISGEGSSIVPMESIHTFTSLLQSDHIAIYESFDVYPTQ